MNNQLENLSYLYKPAAKPVEAVTADTTSCKNRKGAFDSSFSDNLGFWNRPPSCVWVYSAALHGNGRKWFNR